MGKHGAFCLRAARDCILVNPVERGEMGPDLFRAASSSMRRLGANCFPLPSERRYDQKSGNESSGQDFRSTRPSLAVNYMAHVADSQRFLLQGPLFSKASARADSQKRRSPVPFRIASRARKRENCRRGAPMLALYYPNEASYAQPH